MTNLTVPKLIEISSVFECTYTHKTLQLMPHKILKEQKKHKLNYYIDP